MLEGFRVPFRENGSTIPVQIDVEPNFKASKVDSSQWSHLTFSRGSSLGSGCEPSPPAKLDTSNLPWSALMPEPSATRTPSKEPGASSRLDVPGKIPAENGRESPAWPDALAGPKFFKSAAPSLQFPLCNASGSDMSCTFLTANQLSALSCLEPRNLQFGCLLVGLNGHPFPHPAKASYEILLARDGRTNIHCSALPRPPPKECCIISAGATAREKTPSRNRSFLPRGNG